MYVYMTMYWKINKYVFSKNENILMGPDLRMLDKIIICVASSICYTQAKLPKITSSPKQYQLRISP